MVIPPDDGALRAGLQPPMPAGSAYRFAPAMQDIGPQGGSRLSVARPLG
jgi:hypothetical protein